jgi:hypothetical protein
VGCALCYVFCLTSVFFFFWSLHEFVELMHCISEVCLLLTAYIEPAADKHKLLSSSSDATKVRVTLKFHATFQPSAGSELSIQVWNEHVIAC